jgi:biopolymer transport protein ExbB/TolQ
MLYDFVGRIAVIGGECALAILFIVSISCLTIIGDRAWLFATSWLDADLFAQKLSPLLRSQNWTGAKQLAEQSAASTAVVVLAGLSQVQHGPEVTQAAMRAATARERLRLEAYLGLLRVLGFTALLVGTLGTVLDIWEFLNTHFTQHGMHAVTNFDAISVLAPLAGGLVTAIPALFVAGVLSTQAQRVLQQVEFITEFVMVQIAIASRPAMGIHQANAARAA